ncbi:SIS domain-containing protein [Paenibacillus oralis]|uniref:SIS domain-containing protein n=1 Tax=Paenibacillus oralis TaxID=2490856 RepID=A0A3P3TVX0_9BACL|nr:SIS domain-containing protein [Paenibacillus oralis]RRJ62285.1 SIS domain-containing protein [Paenibacillus oralis]
MIAYFESLLKTISSAIEGLDEMTFNQLVNDCVTTLNQGNKLVVSGLGKNVSICDKFVGSMVSLGLNACFLHTNSAIHGDMGVVKDGDLVIILTKSGETSESIYLTRLLQERKINLWLMTFEAESTLARAIKNKLIIHLEHEGDMWNIMPNNSTTLNLIILQALVMQIAEKQNLQLEDFKRNHPGGHIGEVLKGELSKI